MAEDPFAETGIDRTILRPMPGARPGSARIPAPEPIETVDASPVSSGLNPLVAAANPLLNLIGPLRASAHHPNPTALRERLAQQIREFEARAKSAGVPQEKIIAARYALCTVIDESAGSTPWGASGAWAQQGLLALFHHETEGGEKFFQLLGRISESPGENFDLLELMYVCLHFGFEGRYRVFEGGQRQLDAVRQRVLAAIRQRRGEYERELSPHWPGAQAVAQPRLARLPLWVVGAVTALLCVGVYLGFSLSLSSASDAVASQIAALRVAAPSRQPKPALEPRLAPFLAEEIRRGLVAVDDRNDRSVVTILGDGLFKLGDVAVGAADQGLLLRVADALDRVPGQVDVIGHTDNVPIRSLRFASNWDLSRARAESVTKLLSTRVASGRFRADGRADTEPVAENDTPQGRARNRRVEITLYVPAGASPTTPSGAPGRTP